MKFNIIKSENEALIKSLHSDVFEFDSFCENSDNQYWVIRTENKFPAGFCILTKLSDDIAFLSRSGVLKKYRGNKLQKRMIRTREKYARKMGFKSVITYTKIHNIKSSVSLQKSGYMMYKPEYEYADKDCIYWIKVL